MCRFRAHATPRRPVHSLLPYAEHVLEEQPSTKVLPASRREDGIASGEARFARSRPQASLVRPAAARFEETPPERATYMALSLVGLGGVVQTPDTVMKSPASETTNKTRNDCVLLKKLD